MFENLNELFTNHAVLSESAMWGIFGVVVLALLFFDLFIFNRKNEVPNFTHTLVLCILYIGRRFLNQAGIRTRFFPSYPL